MRHETSRPRIVVVDDDSSVLSVVRRQLTTLGWEAFPAATATEALAVLGLLNNVDALLTDLNMPLMDGVELSHEVMRRFPKITVVLMSGAADAVVEQAPNPENAILLRKPFSLQALAAALDTVRKRQE